MLWKPKISTQQLRGKQLKLQYSSINHDLIILESTVISAYIGSVTGQQQHGGVSCFWTVPYIQYLENDLNSASSILSQMSVVSCWRASGKSGDTLQPERAGFLNETASVMYTHLSNHSGSNVADCSYNITPQWNMGAKIRFVYMFVQREGKVR